MILPSLVFFFKQAGFNCLLTEVNEDRVTERIVVQTQGFFVPNHGVFWISYMPDMSWHMLLG